MPSKASPRVEMATGDRLRPMGDTPSTSQCPSSRHGGADHGTAQAAWGQVGLHSWLPAAPVPPPAPDSRPAAKRLELPRFSATAPGRFAKRLFLPGFSSSRLHPLYWFREPRWRQAPGCAAAPGFSEARTRRRLPIPAPAPRAKSSGCGGAIWKSRWIRGSPRPPRTRSRDRVAWTTSVAAGAVSRDSSAARLRPPAARVGRGRGRPRRESGTSPSKTSRPGIVGAPRRAPPGPSSGLRPGSLGLVRRALRVRALPSRSGPGA
jgi:hypothetical protein